MAFAPQAAFDYLRRAHASGKLGHAYLVVGETSATDLATRLAGLVVRANGNDDAARTLAHPDVHVIEPESKSRRIVVEQIRDLENALRLRASLAGGRKVGIVREADRLQVQASNAFLKTLEEPPAQSLLLLVTAQPEILLETIRSRCIKVVLREPDQAAVTAARGPEENALLALLARHARESATSKEGATLSASYLLAREFSGLLSAARGRIQDEQEEAADREKDRYAQTTDGSWLAEREAYYKSLTESRYVAERTKLVELLARWWGDVLRAQSTCNGNNAAANLLEGVTELSARVSAPEVLRKLGKVEDLRANLDRNIQEALALEVAFMGIFGE